MAQRRAGLDELSTLSQHARLALAQFGIGTGRRVVLSAAQWAYSGELVGCSGDAPDWVGHCYYYGRVSKVLRGREPRTVAGRMRRITSVFPVIILFSIMSAVKAGEPSGRMASGEFSRARSTSLSSGQCVLLGGAHLQSWQENYCLGYINDVFCKCYCCLAAQPELLQTVKKGNDATLRSTLAGIRSARDRNLAQVKALSFAVIFDREDLARVMLEVKPRLDDFPDHAGLAVLLAKQWHVDWLAQRLLQMGAPEIDASGRNSRSDILNGILESNSESLFLRISRTLGRHEKGSYRR